MLDGASNQLIDNALRTSDSHDTLLDYKTELNSREYKLLYSDRIYKCIKHYRS